MHRDGVDSRVVVPAQNGESTPQPHFCRAEKNFVDWRVVEGHQARVFPQFSRRSVGGDQKRSQKESPSRKGLALAG